MKKFIWYSIVATLVTLGVTLTIGWPFWAIFILLGVAYAIYRLYSGSPTPGQSTAHPRLAKWIGATVIVVLIGGWAWARFKVNFPLSYDALPWGQAYRDTQIAKLMDPGLSKARAVLVLELRKKEDTLAAAIPALMQAGKHELVITQTQELIDLRKKIEKLLAPPPPAPKPASAKNTPPPRDLGWQRWEVKPDAPKMVRVYNGDEFVYKSPAAFKISEVGGIEHLHNASVSTGEIRSFKFYDLPAEGREIKILPADGITVFWLDFRIETKRTS